MLLSLLRRLSLRMIEILEAMAEEDLIRVRLDELDTFLNGGEDEDIL